MQWKWPDIHGEDKYVDMMGGLHIVFVDAAPACVSADTHPDPLRYSPIVLHKAIPTVKSFLNVSYRKKMRNACQISVLALAILQDKAFSQTNDSFN